MTTPAIWTVKIAGAPFLSDAELDEWLHLFASRNEVAEEYAALMRVNGPGWPGFPEINRVILSRWSPAGLRYIKTRAWKLAA